MIGEEQETGVRYTNISREIHALSGLIKSMMKAKEWNLVHEGVDPLKRRRFETMQRRMNDRFSGLMENTLKDNGARFINAANRFLELAEKHALTIKIDPK